MIDPPLKRLTEDQVDEGLDSAFVRALVAELKERREYMVRWLSAAGGVGLGQTPPETMSARCGRLSAFDEILGLILQAKGKESEE